MSVLHVKEFLAKTSRVSEFKGSFPTQFPIKEVFEVRHQIMPVRTLVGKKVIIYYGNISVKVFYIHKENLTIHVEEHVVPYRGFVMGETASFENVDIQSRIEDIFIEIEDTMQISIVGVISTELSFFRNKAVSLSEVQQSSEGIVEVETQQNQQERPVDDEEKTVSSSSEIFTEVIGGINQELSITLK